MTLHVELARPGRFVITAPYADLTLCQGIPSRRFVKASRKWAAPATRLNCKYLLGLGGRVTWTTDSREAATSSVDTVPATTPPFPAWYKFRTPPRKHQIRALDLAWGRKQYALFMAMGTGKTKTAIDLACASAMDAQIEAVVIAAPLGLWLTWADQVIEKHGTVAGTFSLVQGPKVQRTLKVSGIELGSPLEWYFVGVESLSAGRATDTLLAAVAGKKFAVFVDESARIKNPDAVRTKNAIRIGAAAQRRVIMSGLPMTKGPMDLYSQFEFLHPNIIGAGDFYSFRNRYAVMGGYENREILGYQNLEELTEILRPWSYVLPADAADIDLPPAVNSTVKVELVPAQMTVLKQIKDGMVGTRVLKNVLEAVLRRQQVVSGFTIDDKGEEFDLVAPGENPRIAALCDTIEATDERVVVWCKFKRDRRNVSAVLRERGHEVVGFDGDDADPAFRQQQVDTFEARKARVFVGTPGSGGIGFTLVAASVVCYYSHSWELEHRLQSEARSMRIGQTASRVLYVDLVSSKIDEFVLGATHTKKDLTSYVQEMLRSGAQLEENFNE